MRQITGHLRVIFLNMLCWVYTIQSVIGADEGLQADLKLQSM